MSDINGTIDDAPLASGDLETRKEACVREINEVLARHGFLLNPYLAFNESGVIPQVRLTARPQERSGASA